MVPGTILNLLSNPLTFTQKPLARYTAQHSFLVHGQEPVERRPAQQARMCIVSSSRARLPDAFVGLVPILCHVFSKPDQHALCGPVEFAAGLPISRARANHLAIDIELKLFTSIIADAYRKRIAIAA